MAFTNIKRGFFSVLLVFSSVLLALANEESALVKAQHEIAKVDSLVETVDAKIEEVEHKYNPTPTILAHVADAHKFDLFEQVEIPLPCIVYNSTDGLQFFMYSSHEPMLNGTYVGDHHGGLKRADEEPFIDFSITKNVFTMLLGAIVLIIVLISVANAYKKNAGKAPKGLQSVLEPVFVFLRDDVAKPGIGPKYEKYLPYISTIFFFVLINNIFGLIPVFPGGANVTGNIAVTLVLALIAFVVINVSGNKDYWAHTLNPDVPVFVKPILIPVEILGLFTKPISLMIRLFANILAGHIIVLSLISLIFVFGNAGKSIGGSIGGMAIAIPFTLFISVIEVLVAFVQAYIFANLTSVFIGLAVAEHAHHDDEHGHH